MGAMGSRLFAAIIMIPPSFTAGRAPTPAFAGLIVIPPDIPTVGQDNIERLLDRNFSIAFDDFISLQVGLRSDLL